MTTYDITMPYRIGKTGPIAHKLVARVMADTIGEAQRFATENYGKSATASQPFPHTTMQRSQA